MPITINGVTKQVPDVYGSVKILNSGASAIPNFNGLLIVGSARQGMPYTAGTGYQTILPFTNVADALAYYGESDLVSAMAEAKKGGAGVVNLLNTAPITKSSFTFMDTAGTPKALFDIIPVSYGAPSADTVITCTNTGGVITITIVPVKNVHFITTDLDATGAKTIALDGVSGLAVGDAIKTVDNASASYQSVNITDIDTINNKIIVDTTVVTRTQANYARILKLDTDNKRTRTWNTTDTGLLNSIMNWFTATSLFTVTRGSTYVGDITLINGTYNNALGLLASATKGTSPVATETVGGDFVLCASTLPRMFEEYTSFTKNRIRIVNVISSDLSYVHGAFLALASTQRQNQYSIQVVAGCALGDVNLAKSAPAYPIMRAKSLNSDDFILAGTGYDGMPPYKSLAPQFAGMLSANAVKRNLTADSVVATSVEYFFGDFNKETETTPMLASGVLIIQTDKSGYSIAQAVNTYQKHDAIWNISDKKTYLIQQRQIVDYVYETYRLGMNASVGTEGLTPITASSMGLDILDGLMVEGVITDRKIAYAKQVGNAIITAPSVTPLNAVDFIGFELLVAIPS